MIWYRKAAAQGNQSAIESVARLEREHIEAKHTAYAKTESGKAPFFSLDDKLSPNDEKCRTKLIFICLFLGCLGVHNFMMGEKKKGIVKIVATYFYGIGIILNIIDLVKIIKRTYTVDPNAFF